MAKNKHKPSPQTLAEAEAVAKATQRPGQTKEQTKLIAKGIQKGIAEYKKRQKAKARLLDKKLRQAKSNANTPAIDTNQEVESEAPRQPLPWILLGISWLLFIAYYLIAQA